MDAGAGVNPPGAGGSKNFVVGNHAMVWRSRLRGSSASGLAIVLSLFMVLFGPNRAEAAPDLVMGGEAGDTILIRGRVVDGTSGQPLPGAQVTIVELKRSAVTAANGIFAFERVASGKYTLQVGRIGYRRATQKIEVAPGDSVILRIPLELSALEVPGVTVTTSGARSGEDQTRTITVLSGQELARQLDATIAATLDGQPGVTMSSSGPATARPVIRGLGGDRILILEDGDRVGDLSASSPDHAVSVEAVTAQQIEVVRGPSALLFGSNALGGVVNVIREEIPTSPTAQPHGSFNFQGQSVNRGVSGGGYVTAGKGPLAFRVEGSARTAGDIHTPAGVLENTESHAYSLSAGGSWVGERGYTGLSYRFYDSGYGVPGEHHHHDHGPGDPADHDHDHDHHGVSIDMRRHTVRLGALHRPAGGRFSSLEFNGAFNHYEHQELEGEGEIGTEFRLLSGTAGLLARNDGLGPFSGGAIGIQGQWRDLEIGGEVLAPPTVEYALAGFITQELDLSPVRLEFGARYDWHRITPRLDNYPEVVPDRTFGAVSASAAGLYEFSEGIEAGVNVSRAFRTPDASELYSTGPHLATYSIEIGNPDLEAEIGLGTDLFVRFTRDRVRGEVAVYRNSIENYIFPRNLGVTDSATGLPVYQFAGENAVLVGFEARTEWSVTDRLVLDGTISQVRGTLTAADEPIPFIPPRSGRIAARYDAPSFFVGGGVKLAARQDRVGEFEDPTAGYAVLDANVGYRWINGGRVHTLTLRADNITDKEYRDHLSRIKDIMPQPGRSISLLYRLHF